MSKNSGKFFLGALVGTAVGAVAGILFAPKSGKETRRDIAEKAKETADKGREFVKKEGMEIKEATEKVVEKIKTK